MSIPYFTPVILEQLQAELEQLNEKYEKIMLGLMSIKLENKYAQQYMVYGFLRRTGTLKRCIENIYFICPPDRLDKPTNDERKDTEINLQSFYLNVFGCIDNIAWIWVKELKLKDTEGNDLSGKQIGLFPLRDYKHIKRSFSKNFRDYINTKNKWYQEIVRLRHGLAHRMPLYIPPYIITPEKQSRHDELEKLKNDARTDLDFQTVNRLDDQQDDLGIFRPWMSHSELDQGYVLVFHAQILADWNLIIEMSEKFLEELDRYKQSMCDKDVA